MKHTGDYELDEINILEQECADLEEENKRLEREIKRLKELEDKIEENKFYFKAQMEMIHPKTVREAESLIRAKHTFEELYSEELRCLEKENKKLELQIAELMGERDGKQMKIDRLEKRIKEHVPTQVLTDFRNRFKD